MQVNPYLRFNTASIEALLVQKGFPVKTEYQRWEGIMPARQSFIVSGAGSFSPDHLTPYLALKSARHFQKFSSFSLWGAPWLGAPVLM